MLESAVAWLALIVSILGAVLAVVATVWASLAGRMAAQALRTKDGRLPTSANEEEMVEGTPGSEKSRDDADE